jgi:hypothetical protein
MLIAEKASSPTIQKTFFDLANKWAALADELDDALRLRDAVNELDQRTSSNVRTKDLRVSRPGTPDPIAG